MSRLKIETFILGPDETNCYLISSGSDAVVIDAGMEPDRLIKSIEKDKLALQAVYLTHFHLDHVGGVRELLDRYPVPVHASPEDQFLLDISLEAGGIRELAEYVDFPREPLRPGRLRVLGQDMIVLDTPGHTPGSLSFFFPSAGCVFVGDLLFMIAGNRVFI